MGCVYIPVWYDGVGPTKITPSHHPPPPEHQSAHISSSSSSGGGKQPPQQQLQGAALTARLSRELLAYIGRGLKDQERDLLQVICCFL